MRGRNADLAMAAAFAVLGGTMAGGSVGYGIFAEGGRIGPGFMPFVAGVALVAFSGWTCVEIAVGGRGATTSGRSGTDVAGHAVAGEAPAGPAGDAVGTDGADAAGAAGDGATVAGAAASGQAGSNAAESAHPRRTERKVVLVVLLAAGAATLVSVTGFLLAFGLLILVLLAAVEREPLWLAAGVSAAAVTVSWLVFVRLLGIPLPGGALGLLGGG